MLVPETKLFNEAVTLTGYGKYNIYLLLATGGCLMCVIVETMCMAFIIPAAQCDLNLSLAQKGILASISFLGVITTSHFWGFMADIKGRRNILVFCLISSSLVSLVCTVVPWAWLFILLRFLNGALIGGSSSIIYAFAGEFHNDRYRPMVISWICSFVAAGQMYIPGMAWAILPNEWSYDVEGLGIAFRPWRFLLVIYALPSLVVAAMLAILPESPKFLLAQGKHDLTLRILTRMFVLNTGKKSHEYPVSVIVLDEIQAEKNDEKVGLMALIWQQTVPIFKKEHVFKTMLLCYLQFGIFLSASALSLWFPEILNLMTRFSQNVPNSEIKLCASVNYGVVEIKLQRSFYNLFQKEIWRNNTYISATDIFCDDSVNTDVFLVTLVIGFAIGFTYVIIGILINKVGKKSLLVGAAAVTAACGLVAQYISGYTAIQILIGIYLLISSCIGVVNALVVDLYPTNIRAMALAISLMFGRLGAMVGSNVVGTIFYNYCDYLFVFFAANHLILIIAAILLPTPKKLECSEAN